MTSKSWSMEDAREWNHNSLPSWTRCKWYFNKARDVEEEMETQNFHHLQRNIFSIGIGTAYNIDFNIMNCRRTPPVSIPSLFHSHNIKISSTTPSPPLQYQSHKINIPPVTILNLIKLLVILLGTFIPPFFPLENYLSPPLASYFNTSLLFTSFLSIPSFPLQKWD